MALNLLDILQETEDTIEKEISPSIYNKDVKTYFADAPDRQHLQAILELFINKSLIKDEKGYSPEELFANMLNAKEDLVKKTIEYLYDKDIISRKFNSNNYFLLEGFSANSKALEALRRYANGVYEM